MYKYLFLLIFVFLFSCKQNSYNLQTAYTPVEKKITDFTFQNHKNEIYKKNNLLKNWSLLFFGYTHCPDICLPTLYELTKSYQQLEKELPKEKLPQVIFITVDPERDTTLVLKNYIQNFHADFLAIKSTQDETVNLAKQLGIFYYKDQLTKKEKKHLSHQKNLPTTNYLVNHNGSILLLDDQANLVGIFSTPHRAKNITQVLLKKIL